MRPEPLSPDFELYNSARVEQEPDPILPEPDINSGFSHGEEGQTRTKNHKDL
jgi:hypothetical protein